MTSTIGERRSHCWPISSAPSTVSSGRRRRSCTARRACAPAGTPWRNSASACGFERPFASGRPASADSRTARGSGCNRTESRRSRASRHLLGDANVVLPDLRGRTRSPTRALSCRATRQPSGLRMCAAGFSRAATESLNTTMRAIGRSRRAPSSSRSAREGSGSTPASRRCARRSDVGRLVVQPELVLDVDDERVDLGRVGHRR